MLSAATSKSGASGLGRMPASGGGYSVDYTNGNISWRVVDPATGAQATADRVNIEFMGHAQNAIVYGFSDEGLINFSLADDGIGPHGGRMARLTGAADEAEHQRAGSGQQGKGHGDSHGTTLSIGRPATDDVELGRGAIPPGQDTEPAPTRSFSGDARSADASARRRRCAEENPDRRAMCSTVAEAQAGSPSSRRAASMRVRRICSLIPPGNAVSRP